MRTGPKRGVDDRQQFIIPYPFNLLCARFGDLDGICGAIEYFLARPRIVGICGWRC